MSVVDSPLALSIANSVDLNFALGLLALVGSLTFPVLVFTILLRLGLIRSRQRHEKFLAIWRPIIARAVVGVMLPRPRLTKWSAQELLLEWNSLFDKLTGPSQTNLREFAVKLGLAGIAAKLLVHRDQRKRLIAITALGNLAEERAWSPLAHIAQTADHIVALASLRALFKINRNQTIKHFAPLLISRTDWPLPLVSRLLKEIDSKVICVELFHYLNYQDIEVVKRFIHFMNVCKCNSSTHLFNKVLETATDHSLVTLTLKSVHDPESIELVIRYLQHTDWTIRVAAVTAVGKIGTAKHIDNLLPLLSDKEWWVRYRTAQAIVGLSNNNKTKLNAMISKLGDRFAVDILNQAIAEQKFSLL